MRTISIDGLAVHYWPGHTELPRDVTSQIVGYSYRTDSAVHHHPRLRRIVHRPMPRSASLLMEVLHWDDGTDLALLDHLLAEQADPGTAFDRALRCELTEPTCRSCHTPHLVAATTVGPAAGPARLRAHTVSATCPTCDDRRFAQHAELLW